MHSARSSGDLTLPRKGSASKAAGSNSPSKTMRSSIAASSKVMSALAPAVDDKKDVMRVFSSELFDELLQAAEPAPHPLHVEGSFSGSSIGFSPIKSRAELARESILQKKAIREEEFQRQFDRAKKDAERRLKEAKKKREKRFQDLYDSLIEEKSGFLNDVQQYLDAKEEEAMRKREQLYQKWCEEVYNPIQQQIDDQLGSVTADEIEARRREMFDKFLATSNKKRLFRDIVIETEYDPLEPMRHSLKYEVNQKDPTKQERIKDSMEKTELLVSKGISPPREARFKVRETFDIKMWDKTQATPYGHADPKPKPVHYLQQDRVVMDHYNVPFGKKAVDAEVPLGKKTFAGWKPHHIVTKHDRLYNMAPGDVAPEF